jgi:transglutaminase-like putative cysteine protease
VRRLFLFLLTLLLLTAHAPTPFASPDSETTYLYTATTLYVNQGHVALPLPEDLRSLHQFPNTSWQTTYLHSISHPATPAWDLDRNQLFLVPLPSLAPGGNVTLSYSLHIVRAERVIPEIAFPASLDVRSIPSDLEAYWAAEGPWQGDNPVLQSLAADLQGSAANASNVLLLVTHLADWIGNNVEAVSHDVPRSPLETYLSRQGDCDDQASLLIALCRILKIPAYLQIGCVRNTGAPKASTYWDGHVTAVLRNLRYHAWALIYVPPWGWLPFDMTLGWAASNPLQVVTSAVVWRREVIVMFDVLQSDWAGQGRSQKAYVTANPLYIALEDSLDLSAASQGTAIWEQPAFWLVVLIPPALLGGYFLRRKHLTTAVTPHRWHGSS